MYIGGLHGNSYDVYQEELARNALVFVGRNGNKSSDEIEGVDTKGVESKLCDREEFSGKKVKNCSTFIDMVGGNSSDVHQRSWW
jgi:hypothetical protein